MLIMDVRMYGEDLTLSDCERLYHENMSRQDSPFFWELPDKLYVSSWQAKNIFSSIDMSGKEDVVRWSYWRGIPIEERGLTDETE